MMKSAARAMVFIGIVVAGCETTHNVAVSSYHAVTAPVRYVRRHTNEPSQTTTTNTTTTASNVSNPGPPVPVPSPSPQASLAAHESSTATLTATPRGSAAQNAQAKPKTSPSPRTTAAQPQFPVAKAVPGKPGLVYSPFDPNGGLIDVSGYTPGSKVKDPDS